jgi:hypothetical protein
MVLWPDRSTRRRIISMLGVAGLTLAASLPAIGQDPADPLSKILTDPEKREELKKEKLRPPIEFFRSQVMPNDILPYIKANHWTMVGLEMRANHEDYAGALQSRPVTLADQPHDMIYRRDALLIKGQNARLTMPVFLPTIPKELGFQLIRPEAIRQDEEWIASLRVLEPHQQMIVVLSKSSNDHFARWSQFRATLPSIARRDDPLALDKLRYYRMVLPLDPEKPLLSPHPLTWSPISHVIWDGLSPETLGIGQQQAIVDWLYWGGQLVIVGGAGPGFTPLQESFLSAYLPAEASGENVMRSGDELKPLSQAYLPPANIRDPDEPIAQNTPEKELTEAFGRRYKDPAPIPATAKKPLFFASLVPKPGASVIPLGGPDDPPLGVEWKVGRGRVLMLAVSLSDPDLMGWPGFDTLVRRVVLRRPEERKIADLSRDANQLFVAPHYESLNGPDLTTVRYLSRDLGAPTRQAVDEDGLPVNKAMMGTYAFNNGAANDPIIETPVGEWLDSAALPILCRDTLENASGIEIPGRSFVLKVILGYIFVLVPLNYAFCRYVLRRREWAWVLVPTLSFAFAIGVERAAAYDVGYDSSCDEVDMIETHGDYPRGHLSRFASLYSTGRVKFSISYPNDPTALALPLATGRALRGEDSTLSSFQSQPIPSLSGFQVQPRSLAMFRAEQMASLPGTVTLSAPGDGPRSIVNDSGLDLKDAWIVEIRSEKEEMTGAFLGEIASGAKVPLGSLETIEPEPAIGTGKLDPGAFLQLLLKRSVTTRPEEVGELRLIAWANKPMAGQAIDPPVDRQRGFTLVVAHLQPSPLLSPDSPRYYAAKNDLKTVSIPVSDSETKAGQNGQPPIIMTPRNLGTAVNRSGLIQPAATPPADYSTTAGSPATQTIQPKPDSTGSTPDPSQSQTPNASESFRP